MAIIMCRASVWKNLSPLPEHITCHAWRGERIRLPGPHDGDLVGCEGVFFCDAGLAGCETDGSVVLEPVISARLCGERPVFRVEMEDSEINGLCDAQRVSGHLQMRL